MKKISLIITIFLLFLALIPVISTPLSVSTNKSVYKPNEKVIITVSGSPGTVVGIQVLRPGGETEFVDQKTIGSNGKASTSFKLPEDHLGKWKVVVSGGGETAQTTFNVKGGSKISIHIDKNFISLGDSVTISGSINPAVDASVTIEYRREGGSWGKLATVSAHNGKYSYKWTPSSEGKYYLRSSWPGNNRYFEATSSTISLTVSRKQKSSISAEISSTEIIFGENITVSGCLKPALAGVSIKIIYTAPDGKKIVRTTTTDVNGCFHDTIYPNMSGSWSVKVVWSGNEDYFGSSSPAIDFMVKGFLKASLYLKPTILVVGDYIIIYVNTTPPIKDLEIFFEYSSDKINWSVIGSSYTDKDGVATFIWILNNTGEYFIRARIPESMEYAETFSNILNISVRSELKSIEEYERLLNQTFSLLRKCEEKIGSYESSIDKLNKNITDLTKKLNALQAELDNTKSKLNQTENMLEETKSELAESRNTINFLQMLSILSGIIGFVIGVIVGIIFVRKGKLASK